MEPTQAGLAEDSKARRANSALSSRFVLCPARPPQSLGPFSSPRQQCVWICSALRASEPPKGLQVAGSVGQYLTKMAGHRGFPPPSLFVSCLLAN